jgi:hypothetical protein
MDRGDELRWFGVIQNDYPIRRAACRYSGDDVALGALEDRPQVTENGSWGVEQRRDKQVRFTACSQKAPQHAVIRVSGVPCGNDNGPGPNGVQKEVVCSIQPAVVIEDQHIHGPTARAMGVSRSCQDGLRSRTTPGASPPEK